MLRITTAFHVLIVALVLVVLLGNSSAEDWADITTGLNGKSLTIGLGTPDNLVLRGNAFPVIVAQDGINTMVAAARVSAAGGKVVAFNKENYFGACGADADPSTSLTCRLNGNALRWAAGVPAPGGNGTAVASLRLAITSGLLNTAEITAIKTAIAAQGVGVQLPTGFTSHVLNDLSVLGSGSSRIADVLLTDSYKAFSAAQRAAIVTFVQQGAGLVLGGQAWSTGGNITLYNGNQLLAPLNCIQWTAQYGDARSVTVATTAPDPKLFNVDLAARAFLDHLQGTTVLPADVLQKVTSNIITAVQQAPCTWATPTSSPSAALWASFGSELEAYLSNMAAGWTCGSVDASVPANQVAVAYQAKRQSDMLPEQMTALPCASTFPGSPSAGAATIPSVTVVVNATYAGSYTGPMPPRGGTKWLSTGLWAPAGQPITVTIPPTVAATLTTAGGALGVQVGTHSDNISGKSSWCRLPYSVLQRRWFTSAAGGNSITVTAGLGGLLYITTKWGNTQGPMEVTVSGAMQAPFFFKGVTTEEEWRTTLRNSPAPWAELGSDKLAFTVPSASIRTLDNPQAVVDLWDTVLDGYADLAVFTRDRPRAERIAVDCDISAGWMHNGYPIMAYQSEADRLQLPKWIGRDNGWGWFHELGHNHQWDAWKLPNQGEVTCNLYSLWASENIMKMNRTVRYMDRAAGQAAYFASGTFPASFETTTGMYQLMQLQENAGGRLNYTGGWQVFQRFLSRMQQLADTPAVATDDAKIQTWIVQTSKAANKNMVAFYRNWKFPVTAETEAAVAALPLFEFDPTGPCMEECSNCCLPAAQSPSLEEICHQTVPAGWTFNSKMDSSYYDMGRLPTLDGTWAQLTSACAANPYCQGVNTNGYLKSYVKPQAQWSNTFGDPCQGLLVRQVASVPALPSALSAGASTIQTGSMCVEAPNGIFTVGTRLALAPCAGTAGQVFQASAAPNTNRIQVTASATACVAATSTAVGSAISLATCSTSDSQKWAVDAVGRLLPRNAMMLCLDTESGSSAAGARLVLNTCSDAPSQKFAAAAAAPCSGPVAIANGALPCTSTASGQKCTGTCNTGYTDTPVGACALGQWTLSGSCTPAPCGPTTITNGALSCASTASGQTCTGTCNTGYTGSPVGTCTLGVWSVSGSCSPAACGPTTIPNGALSCASTPSGQTCTGTCNSGYTGLPFGTCTNGVWSVAGSCVAYVAGPIPTPSTLRVGSLCMQVKGSNTNLARLELAACTVSGSQPNSQLFKQGPGGYTSRIQTASYTGTSLCLDVNGGSTAAGTAIILYSCGTGKNQQWVQDAAGRWRPQHVTGMCLDAAGTTAGSQFVMNKCSTAASQQIAVVSATGGARRLLRR